MCITIQRTQLAILVFGFFFFEFAVFVFILFEYDFIFFFSIIDTTAKVSVVFFVFRSIGLVSNGVIFFYGVQKFEVSLTPAAS